MRATGRRRLLTVLAAGVATAVAVAVAVAVALPLSASSDLAAAAGSGPASSTRPAPTGTGDTVCGDVRFDRAKLPGRRATVDNGDWPTAAAANLLELHGWPRAVPYDVAQWTVVTDGGAGVLVASLPGSGFHYLPIHKAADGTWAVGPPCTPH